MIHCYESWNLLRILFLLTVAFFVSLQAVPRAAAGSPEKLLCIKCREFMDEPHQASCGHLYHQQCLDALIGNACSDAECQQIIEPEYYPDGYHTREARAYKIDPSGYQPGDGAKLYSMPSGPVAYDSTQDKTEEELLAMAIALSLGEKSSDATSLEQEQPPVRSKLMKPGLFNLPQPLLKMSVPGDTSEVMATVSSMLGMDLTINPPMTAVINKDSVFQTRQSRLDRLTSQLEATQKIFGIEIICDVNSRIVVADPAAKKIRKDGAIGIWQKMLEKPQRTGSQFKMLREGERARFLTEFSRVVTALPSGKQLQLVYQMQTVRQEIKAQMLIIARASVPEAQPVDTPGQLYLLMGKSRPEDDMGRLRVYTCAGECDLVRYIKSILLRSNPEMVLLLTPGFYRDVSINVYETGSLWALEDTDQLYYPNRLTDIYLSDACALGLDPCSTDSQPLIPVMRLIQSGQTRIDESLFDSSIAEENLVKSKPEKFDANYDEVNLGSTPDEALDFTLAMEADMHQRVILRLDDFLKSHCRGAVKIVVRGIQATTVGYYLFFSDNQYYLVFVNHEEMPILETSSQENLVLFLQLLLQGEQASEVTIQEFRSR